MGTIPYSATAHGLVAWPYILAGDPAAKPIPANWTRDTDYDTKYLQGHATTGGGTGGGATHTHTSDHGHSAMAHTHTHALTTGTAQTNNAYRTDLLGTNKAAGAADHTHAACTSSSANETFQNDTTALTAKAAEPAYIECVFIRPDDANQNFPQYGVCLLNDTGWPHNFAVANGDNDAPDMDGRFMKGAAGGGDGGGTGGSNTHAHGALDQHDHDHGIDGNHTHPTSYQCGIGSVSTKMKTAVTANIAHRQHHGLSLGSVVGSPANTNSQTPTVETVTSKPKHAVLLALENTGAATTPPRIIIPFTGSTTDLADFPDWALCDGSGGTPDLTSCQVQCTTDGGAIAAASGSDTHVHEVASHNHVVGGHSHNGAGGGSIDYTDTCGALTASGYGTVKHTSDHGHTIGYSGGLTGTAAAFDSGSSDVRQPYRDVLWIMHQPQTTLHIKGAWVKGAKLVA